MNFFCGEYRDIYFIYVNGKKKGIMSTNQLLATKTTTKTTITTEQSQKLIQTMLTMSFGCLAFLRGLFPDDNFVDQRFVPEKIEKTYNKNLTNQANSIKIKTLVRGKSQDVDLLLDWLEKGVFQSIRLKYLKSLSFGIYLDENDPTDLCENYIFNFNYDNNNNVNLKINEKNDDNVGSISLLDSRKMAQQLMRRFIIITQSLEPLPQKKYLTMRLMFNENVKQDYQPSLFKDATFDKRATVKVPLNSSMDTFYAGSLNSYHHNLRVNVYSTNDEYIINNTNKQNLIEGKDYKIIDPFQITLEETWNCSPSSKWINSQSQTTNILRNFLKSTQPSIDETQITSNVNGTNVDCDCLLPCPSNATAIKTCRICRKSVHGICYGNYYSQSVPSCFSCILDDSTTVRSSNFQDMMILRKCYRYLSRCKKLPKSSLEVSNALIDKELLNEELIEKFSFAFSVLLYDGVITLNSNLTKATLPQSVKVKTSKFLFDIPGIKIPELNTLEPDYEYDIHFIYNIETAHSCYTEPFPSEKEQVDAWLNEISDLRMLIAEGLPASCRLKDLVIQDSTTQDPISIGKKRKHLELNDYLNDGESSIVRETLQPSLDTPKKIQKISVSKKTLRSIW